MAQQPYFLLGCIMLKELHVNQASVSEKKLRSCRRELMHYHCQKVEPKVVNG